MIESNSETNRNLEKALQALEQAKQRVANEKKKQNGKKRKAENHHKYIMGGIVVKCFPDCYRYDEGELNRILSVALQTRGVYMCHKWHIADISLKSSQRTKKLLPHNPLSPMPKMKAGAIRNDKRGDIEKPR